MHISVDNQIVRLFSLDTEKVLSTQIGLEDRPLFFSWPSFLEYLEIRHVFAEFPSFNHSHPLFQASVSALCEVGNPEDLFYIYDSLFTETIKSVKALPFVNASFLLEQILAKKEKLSFWETEKIIGASLRQKEKDLRENASGTMHDLILYLAWDRMCIAMAALFDYQSEHLQFRENLKKLKWCLIESYQHIAKQRKTSPSFYRLTEALFYYQMREEHLQHHPEEDWELLTQSFPALKDPHELIDFFYIDHAVVDQGSIASPTVSHFTADSPDLVQSRLALAEYTMRKLKSDFPAWDHALAGTDIIYLSL